MKNNNSIIGYGSVIAAAFFLLTPNISLFDFAPDFISYILLYKSLSKISNVIPHFEDAREDFLKLFWISLSKIPALFIMLAISSTHTSERSIIAVFSLVYSIVELLGRFYRIGCFSVRKACFQIEKSVKKRIE